MLKSLGFALIAGMYKTLVNVLSILVKCVLKGTQEGIICRVCSKFSLEKMPRETFLNSAHTTSLMKKSCRFCSIFCIAAKAPLKVGGSGLEVGFL